MKAPRRGDGIRRGLVGPALLLLALTACGDDPPPENAGPPRDVVHLVDRWDDVVRTESPLQDLSWTPTLTLSMPANGKTIRGPLQLYWPALPGSVSVRAGDSPIEPLDNQRSFRQGKEGTYVAAARKHWSNEDLNTEGRFSPKRVGLKIPAHTRLRKGQKISLPVDSLVPEMNLRLSARSYAEGASLAVLHNDEFLGEVHPTDDFALQEETIAVSPKVSFLTLEARGPENTDLIGVAWAAVESDCPDQVHVNHKATDAEVTVQYLPVPPGVRHELLFAEAAPGRTAFLAVGGPISLEFDAAVRAVRVDGVEQDLGAISGGRLELSNVEPGLHDLQIEADATPRVHLHQPLAELLLASLDPDYQVQDPAAVSGMTGASQGEELGAKILARFECGRDRRVGYWMPDSTVIEQKVTVHPGDRLRFGIGAGVDVNDTDGELNWKVQFDPGSGEFETLDSGTWEPDDETFTDHENEFGVDATIEGTLRFEMSGSGRTARMGILTDPRVVPHSALIRKRPNVIMYLIDTLRADGLSTYGNPRRTSPVLDRLADEGYLFENCYSVASWTRPTVATLFSGLYPLTHGSIRLHTVLPFGLPTLAETLQTDGYSTWAYVGTDVIAGRGLHFEQGFHRFATRQRGIRSSVDTHENTMAWLENHHDEPFFLYLHSLDPHSPYNPPSETVDQYDPGDYAGVFKDMKLSPKLEFKKVDEADITERDVDYVLNRYHEEIVYQDEMIGKLLDELDDMGLRDNTILVFVSDHGEQFYEHGGWEHSNLMWQELLKVPLIFSVPPALAEDLAPPRRMTEFVSQVDVMPTLLEMLEVTPLGPMQGNSFLPLMRGDASGADGRDLVYMEEQSVLGAIVLGHWKLSWKRADGGGEKYQLFNLEKDPGEQNDLAAEHADVVERLVRRRDQKRAENDSVQINVSSSEANLGSDVLSQLYALGYLGDE